MPNLVGIGNSQVPTNAMLGGLAYQDSVGEINIDKIKAKTSDTAVDIFVYDTRKDSDGGAWRHRTQNTSWYNEGASATRGARKEFPSVAVVVAADGIYTIYDGDDPNLPMWMVFEHDASSGARIARQGTSAITMLNGLMCATRSGSQRAAGFASFIDDTGYQINEQGKYLAIGGWDGLVNRNATGSFTGTDSSYGLAGNGTYYDVAMTVLPNAPIDDATGIQIPTIAIAHNSGISIITDSPTGVVYDLTANAEANDVAEIAFLADNRYSFATTANNSRWWVDDIQTADENHNYFYQRTTYDYSQGSQGSINPLGRNNGTGRGELGEAIFRQASGMSRIRYVDTLINYTTTNYNTGWFVGGNIEGVFLSDTDTTDLVASNLELVTNGTFDSDSNWTKDGSWTISGGTATNSGSGNINQTIAVVSGKRYLMTATMDFTGDSSLGNTTIGFRNTANSSYYAHVNMHTEGTANAVNYFQLYWTSTVTGNVLARCYSVDGVSIDNWSVQSVDGGNADRSTNNKGLQVFGTIQKDPVATGAELVTYSGFSNSNYLFQPHNTDLQFGTGDYSIMLWYKASSASTGNREIFVKVKGSSTGFWLLNKEYTNKFVFDTVTDPNTVSENVWYHVAGVRESGTAKLYVNGELVGSASSGDNITDTSEGMIIGQDPNNNGWRTQGSLALVRISASTPSAEAIKKTYNDEKYLFRDNAKCTLYGTANNVTALAYDDTKNILHVGTNSGRSEFRGLNRINNTTTAVTTAISASNGLVAEQ